MGGWRRILGVALTTLMAATFLTACGSDSSGSKLAPRVTVASRDADGFTAEQREVIDAVKKFNAILFSLEKGDTSVDLKEVATDDVAKISRAGVKQAYGDKDRVIIGKYELTPKTVSIDGDKARYCGCNDFSNAVIVKKGQKKAGVGSSGPVGKGIVEYQLIRDGEQWLVADTEGLDKPC